MTFADFVTTHWETYLSQNLKPSTQSSHRSNVRNHLLPKFGKLRLSEITPLQIMEFLKEKSAARTKAQVAAEPLRSFAEDAQSRGVLRTFSYEPNTAGFKAQGGANGKAVPKSRKQVRA